MKNFEKYYLKIVEKESLYQAVYKRNQNLSETFQPKHQDTIHI